MKLCLDETFFVIVCLCIGIAAPAMLVVAVAGVL